MTTVANCRCSSVVEQRSPKPRVGGSIPSTFANPYVAQLDSAGGFYLLGCRFESCRAGQSNGCEDNQPARRWGVRALPIPGAVGDDCTDSSCQSGGLTAAGHQQLPRTAASACAGAFPINEPPHAFDDTPSDALQNCATIRGGSFMGKAA